MGALTWAIIAEVFIQYLEHTRMIDILKKFQIIDYHRYVDDILIKYNTHTTNINNTLEEFNKIHPKIKFTIEKEENNKINFLDLSITKTHNKILLAIYRKTHNDRPNHTQWFMPPAWTQKKRHKLPS
jgi:nucleoside-specific outer membrane channel protein Tsx